MMMAQKTKREFPYFTPAFAIGWICLSMLVALPGYTQSPQGTAAINSSIGSDGTGTIVVEARGQLPEPPVFFTAKVNATATVGLKHVEQSIQIALKVIQGKAKTLSLGIRGDGMIRSVEGEGLRSWSVRQVGTERFLDLHLNENQTDVNATVSIRSAELELPMNLELTHFAPGEAVGFDSTVSIQYDPSVEGTVAQANGFAPLDSDDGGSRLQTSTGGNLQLALNRSGAAPSPVELVNAALTGEVHPNGQSIGFEFGASAVVSEDGAQIAILSGTAAVSEVPDNENYRLRITMDQEIPVYKLVFPKAGTYPVSLDFVAALTTPEANWQGVDFTVGASAVIPMSINGLDAELEFHRDQLSVAPVRDNESWIGFLPATGRARLQWKTAREAGEGKLFFTSTGQVEAKVGAGLLRQDHQIEYKVLQGELNALTLLLGGPGEILDVQGQNIVAWKVSGQGDERQLDITLSQPITASTRIDVRSQTPLDAFPVRVEGLRLNPVGAIRHSGFLRLSNLGSVRLEPTGLSGLTQLSPEQFPGEATEARQVFVYRFPAADHAFTIAADRIQPEVNISELVLYQIAEADRVIQADIELDIREAPIREWDFGIPEDYSVVSVSGASVADYIVASEATDGQRNLKVVFAQDVIGRQLVTLHLEKSQPAAAEQWVLPRIEYPEAKSVRGDIGIVGAPGYRIAVESTELLVEKPLSYFPKPTAGLQHAFRIREPAWTATTRIEPLQRSIQSDVFHLYSLSQETVYGSALINFFVTGAPVAQWRINVPQSLGNVMVDGQDVRTWRREDDTLIVSLHQPVMGAYTLLVTFEEKPDPSAGTFQAGQIAPLGVQGERGYIQVVSPMQVAIETAAISEDMLVLDPLELPAEFRLLTTAPPLGTWQYTGRPFQLTLNVNWFEPGTTATQVVEFSEANTRVSQDGELVTDVLYYVKSRGRRTFRIRLPDKPVRLWEITVNGQVVTARQADDVTLIPLPGGTDPNIPIEVSLRLGKPAVDESNPELNLPIVLAPVLKTQWNVVGDEHRVLVPDGGTVSPPAPVTRSSGFDWVAKRGIIELMLIGLFTVLGAWLTGKTDWQRAVGLVCLLIAVAVCVVTVDTAFSQIGSPKPLQLSVPVLSEGESVQLWVQNTPLWRVDVSWFGIFLIVGGIAGIVWTFVRDKAKLQIANLDFIVRCTGSLLIALGLLMQGGGAPWFFALLAIAILVLVFARPALEFTRETVARLREQAEKRKARKQAAKSDPGTESGGAVTTSIMVLALAWASIGSSTFAAVPSGFEAAESIEQQWQISHRDSRLNATGTITLSGQPGNRFLLLRAPAVLSSFEGDGLRLTKADIPGVGLSYVISIPLLDQPPAESTEPSEYRATFEFQLEAITASEGVPVLTGTASVQRIQVTYDEPGWDVASPTAVRVESVTTDEQTSKFNVLLGPGEASIRLVPKARDVTSEETQFFVEAFNLYLPGPGVVDGRHRLRVRTSQGQVRELTVSVPAGLTVSEVRGPVGSWQFDADSGSLKLEVEPPQSQLFDITIDTQRGLDPLPSDVDLAPLLVADADGQVGLVGIAFGSDAQPERLESQEMSVVNLGDFDASLMSGQQAVLHRVYRYGANGGQLALRVVPVEPEVRVMSKQVLSLGDERVVLGINFAAEITRAGLFQLSFPLPDGLEVESLSGAALHHWSELTEGDSRQIILHLNGKTIGMQSFSLTLSGIAPTDTGDWEIPRFALNEATCQTGELVVRPTTGIRLRTVSRENVSETDPRAVGGQSQGSLAFRLLQRDWNLVLGIEKLDPWVTGSVLHDVTLREGQTRTTLFANFNIQNASIRSLEVALPITNDDEMQSLRAIGDTVSDFVRTAPNSNVWEVQFKRRVVGGIDFQIEYERRGDRDNENETLNPASFPGARQISYFFAVRAGGRLELELETLTSGWQRADWSTVPQSLREMGNRSVPTLVLRAVAPANSLTVAVKRHSLADSLKLRVANGTLTTVLSPRGNQLTAVDMTMEVIQRSSLSVGLPMGGELFNIFVNGESVNSIRLDGNANAWQFYILPGMDDRTANVRFVYSVPGQRLKNLDLGSPQLNVPLENIQWNVVAPNGYELTDDDGNLELVRQDYQEEYDRDSYLSKVSGSRSVQAQQAVQLLEQANELLQAGEQTKARWALNSVANQYALDAASNEDARVQLENLQRQQAIVGLNTRRQRLYLDNKPADAALADNQQLFEAAAVNPILQQDNLNFRPQQLSELLRGNSSEDNAILGQIATRLVQHQHTTDPAPQAIIINLPEEGSVYTFGRTVQVAENAPLELELDFAWVHRLGFWQTTLALILLATLATALTFSATRRPNAEEFET